MNIEIANRLVQLRKSNNLSQEDLAGKIGVSRQAVSKWERAEASPDTDNLILLSKIYGISLNEMLASADEPEVPTEKMDEHSDESREELPASGERLHGMSALRMFPYPIVVVIMFFTARIFGGCMASGVDVVFNYPYLLFDCWNH